MTAAAFGALRRRHVVFSGALVVLLAAPPPPTRFTRELPPGVPDLAGFSKASGSVDLEDGSGSLRYELYYKPSRSNYEVIRYRLVGWDGGGGPKYSSNERLQWQAARTDVRRFECEPSQTGGCSWREMPKTAPEYHREMPIVLWVLSVHNRLLHAREDEKP